MIATMVKIKPIELKLWLVMRGVVKNQMVNSAGGFALPKIIADQK